MTEWTAELRAVPAGGRTSAPDRSTGTGAPSRDTAEVPERWGRRIADRYAAEAADRFPRALHASYAALRTETREQFALLTAAGLEVRPWTGPGQPYRDSAELRESVNRTGLLHVQLTARRHGAGTATVGHPMTGRSGVRVAGTDLLDNDLLRVVHDAVGHVAGGVGFGWRDELEAAALHRGTYSALAWPALFSEHVAQVCWFFHGPHLRAPDGRTRRPGQPGYLRPRHRPYPPQKTVLFDDADLDRITTDRIWELP